MAIADLILSTDAPKSAYLWAGKGGVEAARQAGAREKQDVSNILYFQYWPQSLQDDYQVEYSEHNVPGGSHPLYQWVGGQGRTITFQAIFTSEVDETRYSLTDTESAGGKLDSIGQSALTPSALYTVDVDAALSRLRGWMLPSYSANPGRISEASPPPILYLSLRGTKLGGSGSGGEVIRVILRAAPITYESWFPNGRPRIAIVDLTLSEIVQYPGNRRPSVEFIDRKNYENKKYNFRGLGDKPAFSGGI